MNKILSILILGVLCFFTSTATFAQSKHRHLIYLGASFDKDFARYFNASLATQYRLCHATNTAEWLFTPKVSFKPIKYFEAAVEYRANWEKDKDKDVAEWIHRWGASVKGIVSPGNWKFDFRIKYNNYSEDYEDEGNKQYLRFRLQGQYKIKPLKLALYSSYEVFDNLSLGDVDRDRWTFGAKYKITKQHKVGFEYMFQENFNRPNNKVDINKDIFALSYSFSF